MGAFARKFDLLGVLVVRNSLISTRAWVCPSRWVTLWALFLPLVAVWGCGGSKPTPANAEAAANAGSATGAVPADSRTPEQVVNAFLQGSQKGDTAGKIALLTPAARAEWQRAEQSGAGFSMGVDASPSLTFKVGDVELVGETKQEAHVASQLTDKDGEGRDVSENIVWFLLQEQEGWRISGMAMNVIDGELPLILDFENQAEMERKIQLLNQEIARRERDAAGQTEVRNASTSGGAKASQSNPAGDSQAAKTGGATRKR